MNELWKRIAGELLAAGPPATVEQLHRFVRLYELADNFTRAGRSPEYLAMLRPCLPLGDGITLLRPSMGAAAWFEDGPEHWYASDPRRYELAMILCMAHARRPGYLAAITTAARCDECIRDLVARIPITESELVIAARAFLHLADDAEEQILDEHKKADGQRDLGWMIEQICKDYGKTPMEVVWSLTRDEVKLLADEGAERRHREACVKAGRPIVMNPHGRKGTALRAFYAMQDEIKQSFTTPEATPDV